MRSPPIRFFTYLLILTTAASSPLAAQGLVIDSFVNPVSLQATPGNTVTSTQTGLLGVYGGTRTATLTNLAGLLSANLDITSGFFFHSNNTTVSSRAVLEYGSPLNANLGSTGAFVLNQWTLDQGSVLAKLTLVSGSTSQSATMNLAASLTPVNYQFDFLAFPLIDLNDVDTIQLEFLSNNPGQDSSIGLGGFSVIPEPQTAAALCGLIVFGAVSVRRWRMVRSTS
jgi:hypothetical protein